MRFTLQEQRALLPGFSDAQLHQFFNDAPRPAAASTRASRPAAQSPSAAIAAAFERDVIARRAELDALAGELANRGIDVDLARPHLPAIESWSTHFEVARARAATAAPGQRGVAGDAGWADAFANARARR